MLRKETVEASTLDLINRLMEDQDPKDFKIVGGTALALMLGHRISVDIDLFTDFDFDASNIGAKLSSKYKVENLEIENNTIKCFIDDVKVDCIAHRYPWIRPTIEIDGIRLASFEDIAAMKFNAIVQNGSRLKDFMDIYAMLEKKSLSELLLAYEQKYPSVSSVTARKALLYHNDINKNEKLNLIRKNISWLNINRRLKEAVINPKKIFEPKNIIIRKENLRSKTRKKI